MGLGKSSSQTGFCEHSELLADVPVARGVVPSHPFSVLVKMNDLHCRYGFFTTDAPYDARYVEVKMTSMDVNEIFVGHGTRTLRLVCRIWPLTALLSNTP